MKILFFLAFCITAFASSDILVLADRVALNIFEREQTLSPVQKEQVKSRLLQIQNIINNNSSRLSCIRYSQANLGYALTDLEKNKRFSTLLQKGECERLLASQMDSLICTRSSYTTLGYKVYSVTLEKEFGIGTSLNNCANLVSSQRNGYFCQYQSHTTFGHLLTRLSDGSTFGQRQRLKTCLGQIPL